MNVLQIADVAGGLVGRHRGGHPPPMPEGQGTMLNRFFPKQVDNRFEGRRAALWLLGLFIALKLVMSVNSILNTASIATGGDGLPLDSFGPAAARTVLMLFALMSLGQLTLAVIALTTLIRYRAMVPFIYLVLLGEHVARRVIVQIMCTAHREHPCRLVREFRTPGAAGARAGAVADSHPAPRFGALGRLTGHRRR